MDELCLKLSELLFTVSEQELKVELERQNLASMKHLLPKIIFDCVISPDPPQKKNKYADPSDLISFMTKFSGKRSMKELRECDFHNIFKIFDYNHDGYLDFEDFILFLLPQDASELRYSLEKTVEQEKAMEKYSFKLQIHKKYLIQICKVIEKEIKYHRRVEKLKREIEKLPGFSILALFRAIDTEGKNFLGKPLSFLIFVNRLGTNT